MLVRQATSADLDELSILFDGYRMFYKQPSDPGAAKQFLSERIERNESVILVAVYNDAMVGFTQLYPIFSSVGMKRAWLLNDLFVPEDARGSGAADALLAAAEQLGADTSARYLMLQTAKDNYRAQRVYERNGWERDAEYLVYNKRC